MRNKNQESENNLSLQQQIVEGLKVQPEYLLIIGICVVLVIILGIGIRSTNTNTQLFAGAVFTIALIAGITVIWLVLNNKKATYESNLTDEVSKLSEKINQLSNKIDSTIKLINAAHYGALNFSPEKFYDIWKKLMYDMSDEFYAFSYITSDEWTRDYAKKLLSPLRSKIETDDAIVERILVVDQKNELDALEDVIEYHKTYKIKLSFVESQKLYQSTPKIIENPLKLGFILIDDRLLAIFRLDKNRKLQEIEIISDSEIFDRYSKIYRRARQLSTEL